MTLMRVRRAAQLTLPADVRQALNVREGDYLDAEVVKGGVLLKPVSVVERKRAWKRIENTVAKVRDANSNPGADNRAEEEVIAGEVKAFRRERKNA